MWCASCQEDVAAEISADGQTLKCTTCGEDVRKNFAPSLHPETKSARELLKKWAEEQKQLVGESEPTESAEISPSGDQLSDEEIKALTDSLQITNSPASQSQNPLEDRSPEDHELSADLERIAKAASEPATPSNRPKFRIDSAHTPLPTEPQKEPRGTTLKGPSQRNEPSVPLSQKTTPTTAVEPPIQVQQEPVQHKPVHQASSNLEHHTHQAHAQSPAPHFDVAEASRKAKARPGRAEAIWGQLMAYTGVGVLTVGTVLVLWGYFGMVEQFASTGWLLSTAGQMLLLLGIVTLVSGGMQQTTHEVTERIEYLGGRMIRIEQSTDQILKGPHFSTGKQHQNVSDQGEQESSAA